METYVVLYTETGYKIGEDPSCFICSADDMEHAEEQCKNAYPDCFIVWVVCFDAEKLCSSALEAYYFEMENYFQEEK